LTGPAGAGGQSIEIMLGGPVGITVNVPAGLDSGHVDIDLGGTPVGTYAFEATAAGVTKSATLTIY